VRIVSLNAWGGQLWEALAAWVPRCGADVLLLQEVTRAPRSAPDCPAPDWLDYRDAYRTLRQRADLFGDLRALLPGWLCCTNRLNAEVPLSPDGLIPLLP